jgi:protease I
MAGKVLDGMRVAIIVTDAFEQAEMTEPRRALEEAGVESMIVAPHDGTVQGVRHEEKAEAFRVDRTLDRVDAGEFDAVLLPGGVFNADALRMNEQAQQFVREIDRSRKPVAVICHGPWLLVSAGLVSGRRLTSYYTIQDDIRNAWGVWEDAEVVRDRNWVSSRSPKDLPAFNREMIALFSEYWNKAGKRHAA